MKLLVIHLQDRELAAVEKALGKLGIGNVTLSRIRSSEAHGQVTVRDAHRRPHSNPPPLENSLRLEAVVDDDLVTEVAQAMATATGSGQSPPGFILPLEDIIDVQAGKHKGGAP